MKANVKVDACVADDYLYQPIFLDRNDIYEPTVLSPMSFPIIQLDAAISACEDLKQRTKQDVLMICHCQL